MKPNQELLAVKYFSARQSNPVKHQNQSAFFQANKENPKFQLILGTFLKKPHTCYSCGHTTYTYEEKETDVRIATQIVADAYEKNCEVAIVVSADSDMIPAVELAKGVDSKVFIYFPPNQYSSNLASMGSGKSIQLIRYESRFKQCLLPDSVTLSASGYVLNIPQKWKSFREII